MVDSEAITAADGTALSWEAERKAAAAHDYIFAQGDIVADNFEIRELIGIGGMSQVYAARDLSLKRIVAIKAALPRVAPGLLRHEAEFLAAFHHPGLVTVFAFGNHKGVDFMVMEKLDGRTLAHYIEQRTKLGSFSIAEALDILIKIAEALAVLHNAGVAHRDLKPENIMIEPPGRLVVMDFGIMRIDARIADDKNPLGTPEYMAPETILTRVRPGEAHLLDLYALGITAHELLTGKRPFTGTRVVRILAQQLKSPLPPLREVRADVPRELARLVAEMGAKSPHARPAGIDIVLAELRALRAHAASGAAKLALSVLVVDDDESVRALMTELIREEVPDATLRTATDGEDGLRKFLDDPPHIMFIDLDMPRMNGVEVCMYLRATKLAEQTTIVVVSSHAGQNRATLERLGVADVITKKHADPDRFAGKIHAVLARVAMAHELRSRRTDNLPG